MPTMLVRRLASSVSLRTGLVVAAFGAGLTLRAVNLGGPTFGFDELYHVFAARSFLAGEGFRLPSGRPYERAELVTLLTAGAFALVGAPIGTDGSEGQWVPEAVARLPALAFGALTLGLLYLAGRRLFGPTAGLVALALLAFSPEAIDADRFARLYSPLTFFGLLAALAAFHALEGRGEEGPGIGTRRLGWLVLAAAAGLVALHLHAVALGLAVAVQAYAALLAACLFLRGQAGAAGRYAAVAVGFLIVEGLVALALPALREHLVAAALIPLSWYRPTSGDAMHYHYHLAGQYAWLWYLVWPATVATVVARPRPGLFIALAFWLPFVLLSGVVATKAPRYLVHLLPFAWLLLGGATEAVWPAARAALLARLQPYLPAWMPATAAAGAVVLLAAVPVLRLTPSVVAALHRPAQTTGAFTTGHFVDWRQLATTLRPWLTPDAQLVTSIPLAARYYLGRHAYHLITAHHRRDDRAGQVQHAEDLAALRAAGALVWVVVERWRWEAPGTLDAGLRQALVAGCNEVPVGRSAGLLAFACAPDRPAESTPPRSPRPGEGPARSERRAPRVPTLCRGPGRRR